LHLTTDILEYTIKKVQENQKTLKLLLVYADDVNILGENINAVKKNTEVPLDTSKILV
jgi:hypothetical protein